MDIDFHALSPKEAYGFMSQAIIPRPIAWVLSDNDTGTYNLAPFSYFSGVSSRPPTLSISIGKKRDGTRKDTWVNIEERGHFVVHLTSVELAQQVSDTSASLVFGDSEVIRYNIALSQEPGWPLPRVAAASVAFLCQKYRIIEIGEVPQGLVIGQINRAYVADDKTVKREDGSLALLAEQLNPLCRLGGEEYAGLAKEFTVSRPQ